VEQAWFAGNSTAPAGWRGWCHDARKRCETGRAPERLTWDEICEHYPDEWVVIADMDRVEDGCFEARKAASPDVKEADKRLQRGGAFFTGRRRG
jgi:hypothetical protein